MNIFIDTNILIDLLTQREPSGKDALSLFKWKDEGHCEIHLSALSVLNVVYILENTYKLKNVLSTVEKVISDLHLLSTSSTCVKKAFKSSFSDFEDAVQYFSAVEAGNIDYIITRDKKGFSKSEIPVLTPIQFIKKHLRK